MPCGMIARQLLDKSARQLGSRSAPRDPDLRSAKISGAICNEPKERIRAVAADVGTLLYLVSLGFVATAVVVVFFGLGFFLLAHPGDEPITRAGLGAHGAEPTTSSSSVPPAQPSETREQVLPAPTGDTAPGSLSPATADTAAANMTFDASRPEQPGLESNKETAIVATLPRDRARGKKRDYSAPSQCSPKALGRGISAAAGRRRTGESLALDHSFGRQSPRRPITAAFTANCRFQNSLTRCGGMSL